jgi:hypothetical protein
MSDEIQPRRSVEDRRAEERDAAERAEVVGAGEVDEVGGDVHEAQRADERERAYTPAASSSRGPRTASRTSSCRRSTIWAGSRPTHSPASPPTIWRKQIAKVKSPKLSLSTPASELPLGLPASQPLLILQGERDYQVTPADDFAPWKKVLAGKKNAKAILYFKLNHLFFAGEGPQAAAASQTAVASAAAPA